MVVERTNLAQPSVESLQSQLKIEWDDHFQTREQSWKTFQFEILLIAGLVGADLKIDDVRMTIVMGIFMILFGIFGYRINKRHRDVQNRIFENIYKLENAIGLHSIITAHRSFKVGFMENLKGKFAPQLMLQMQIIIILFSISYIIARILLYS